MPLPQQVAVGPKVRPWLLDRNSQPGLSSSVSFNLSILGSPRCTSTVSFRVAAVCRGQVYQTYRPLSMSIASHEQSAKRIVAYQQPAKSVIGWRPKVQWSLSLVLGRLVAILTTLRMHCHARKSFKHNGFREHSPVVGWATERQGPQLEPAHAERRGDRERRLNHGLRSIRAWL